MTASRVWCRSGASRLPPRSSANRSSRRRPISATDITRTLRGGQLDRERQPVEPVDQRAHLAGVQPCAGARGRGALAEQLDGVVEAELRQLVDPLGREPERGPGGGEHPQRRRPGDQHRDQVGDRLDEVLAVVEDQQRRRGADLVDDPADQVGTTGRGRGQPAGDRLADAEHVADLDGDALGRGDAGQLDEVHDRLLGEPAHQVREPGLAEAAGADDRGDPRGADRLRQRGDVLVAADQPGRLVEQPLADRAVARQQLGVQRLQGRARVDAEPVGEVRAVGLVALQRGRDAVHGGDGAQQGGDHLVVGVRALEERQRGGVLTGGGQPQPLGPQRPRVDVRGRQASR